MASFILNNVLQKRDATGRLLIGISALLDLIALNDVRLLYLVAGFGIHFAIPDAVAGLLIAAGES